MLPNFDDFLLYECLHIIVLTLPMIPCKNKIFLLALLLYTVYAKFDVVANPLPTNYRF